MTILRTTIWNGLAVAIRLSAGLVLNKVLAVLVGPGGYAVIGQFQNLVQITFTMTAGAINNGITKYTAEFVGHPDAESTLWSTAARLIVGASIVVGVLLIVARRPLAVTFLHDASFSGVFIYLALGITLFSLNTMLLAIVNGKKDLRTYVISNITGSIVMLAMIGTLSWLFGLYGALVAVSLNQAIIFFATLVLCRRKAWFDLARFTRPATRATVRLLFGFATMAAVSAIANNGGQVLVRSILVARFGLTVAGYWDGMIRISQINMLLVATTMSFHFIPRMSELTFWEDIRNEIRAGARLIGPLFAAGAVVAWALRGLVVRTLYTAQFAPMEQLFAWQFAGDTLRVFSWFMAYVMIGRAMILTYVATEILTNAAFVALAWVFVRDVGFTGVAIAHFVTYAIATPAMYVAVRHHPGLRYRRSGAGGAVS